MKVREEEWEEEELWILLRAVIRMGGAMGGPRGMQRAIGGVAIAKAGTGGAAYAFWPWPPWKRIVLGEETFHQEPAWRAEVRIVHELAHIWDAQTANLLERLLSRRGKMVQEMVRFVGEEPGPTCYGRLGRLEGSGCPPQWQTPNPQEEWAESVAAYLYPEYINWLRETFEREAGLRPLHQQYVEQRFRQVREWKQ